MKLNISMFRKLLLLLVMVCSFTIIQAQERVVTGTVTDANDGMGIPGVSVVIKGTTTGTTTDIDGKYALSVNANSTIVYSFVGYKPQEILVGNQTQINVILSIETENLSEVVIVGYGVQKKREITGSISKVESKQITEKIAPSFESALQGQAAGVSVTTGSGMAGSPSVIRIRGIASIGAGGDPLYVVDGIPITQDIFGLGGRIGGMNVNPLASINPNDIESVEILKDAAATGIYGSRGANGVIIITTKRSKKNALKLNFSSKHSISNPSKKPNMMNSSEWLQMYQEAWENDGHTGVPQDLPGNLTWDEAKKNDTDWWDKVTRTGIKQEYNLTATFGNDLIKTYVGASYSDNQSYLKGNDYKRYSGRINLDIMPSKNLSAHISSSLSKGENQLVGNPWEGGLGAAMSEALPIYPIYNPDGTYWKGKGGNGNPLMINDLKDLQTQEVRTINSIAINYSPVKNLNLTLNSAVDYLDFTHDGYEDPYLRSNDKGYAWKNLKWILNYNYSLVANYKFNLPEIHNLTLMAGHEYQRSETRGKDLKHEGATKYLNTNFDFTDDEVTRNSSQKWAFISYFGRANYMFKDRYIAQASLRVDGSSRFGSNNRYGYFPTFALGWILTEEDFLKNNTFISFLKFKTSYGITGNANIDNYAWQGTYSNIETQQSYNGNPVTFPNRYENPDLKWETTNSYDVGFEARFFDGRISTELAYFYKLSSDVLIDVAVTRTSGFGNQWQNIAEIKNQGLEFSFKTRNLIGDFKWTTDFNIATLKNEVTSLGGLTSEVGGGTNDTRIFVGQPVGVNTLVRVSRIDPADGRPIYLDQFGNETKTYKFEGADGYKVPIGKVIPDFTGGFTNTFEYKGFELSTLFTFSYGNKIYDSSAKRQLGITSDWNFRTDRTDRWRKPGDIAKYPRLTLDGSNWGKDGEVWFNSDMWLYDGSYLRLKNLTLAYNVSPTLLKKYNLSNLRFALTGTNLLTFTKYPGADPEVARDFDNAADRNLSPNISWLTPPQERTFTFSINLSF